MYLTDEINLSVVHDVQFYTCNPTIPQHEYHFWLTTNNATCEHNVVPLLHWTEYCSIQLASPPIQNQWMLRRNCKNTKENFLL